MSKPLRVAVISRHELTRAGLTQLIQFDPDRAIVVGAGTAAVRADHDIAVYDLADREATEDRELRRLIASETAVVALLAEFRADVAECVLAMGVADVVSMGVTAKALLERLERAAEGRRIAPAAVRRHARDAARLATGLTEREVAVLELIAAGLSNHQIAAELYVSINTVKSYVRTAYRRIGVTSRSQAVIWAMRQGLGPQTQAPVANAPRITAVVA
jgi:NarL family two-component system response regulator LiaR